MSTAPSAELLARVAGRDEAAAEAIFRRFVGRLTALARRRLARRLSGRVDPEDVVQSALRSFFVLARGGRVQVRESGDLWRLLVRITLRKAARAARRHHAACRSIGREQPSADLNLLAADREPTPAEAAALVDELRGVLAPLGPVHRRIVELRLQGQEVAAIAEEVGRSSRTVRRTLAALGEELQGRLLAATEPRGIEPGLVPYADVVLHQLIGAGGMGQVYRASWQGHPGRYAVKVLRRPLRASIAAAARFRAEAALLARLRHPGLVMLHGVGLLPDGGHFLVMDLVEGADLARVPPPSAADAVRWVAEAAEAIHYAHEQGVIHCDLKPGNLVLGADGHVRVTDFGLARLLADVRSPRGGTEGFLAPEQRDPGGTLSPRTDVHALGAVLRSLLPERGPEVEALCRRCLAVDPKERFASAADLARALRALAAPRGTRP